jgi:hypothetical protein
MDFIGGATILICIVCQFRRDLLCTGRWSYQREIAAGHVQFVPHKNKTKERTMHKHIIAAILAATISSGAMAQADTGSHNPAVKNPTVHTTAMAAKGHNSFTESQARGRIAKDGYTDVSKLTKNANGVWEGTAMKAGAKVKVALDYKGNVTTH